MALWLTWPLIEDDGSLTKGDAIWVYGALTLGFLIAAFYLAAARSYLLDSLHYAVTDRRAIVRREGRNHVLASRAYLVSCEHSSEFPYHIAEGRPHPSLTVGALLSEDVVQPFGYGLTHPGWGPLRDRGVIPVLFEQIADAEAVRALLLATSDASAAGQP
ncbi:hypothetical protein SAMN04488567_3566 [Limimaricola pyoseonensis]|uniref:Uncharacterized protein n=1 Tax=Limimaricola pyoseonensis TaxID=521013 RepID=A0A1G7IY09_9RHOB|nr:hypothetical protein SAMN04488567_3566 [Limimaricola pyoseonensis]